MSQLELSEEMIEAVQKTMEEYDERAGDLLMMLQYLGAITGYKLAVEPMDSAQKRELLNQLFAFTSRVLDDFEQPAQPPEQEEAFGIWKPGDE
ncbi:MAG: hypothetical protein AAF512_24575 [Pseudomonadota bacterium]